jgi:hypothetical protein
MKDNPNWAEIVSAMATTMATLVALPAVYLLMRDRADRRRATLRVTHSLNELEGGLLIFRVAYMTPDHSQALFADIKLISKGSVWTDEQYRPPAQGVLSYGGANYVMPNGDNRKIRVPLRYYINTPDEELGAYFGLTGCFLSSGITLKVTVVTHPRRRTMIQRKATISSTN